MVGLRKSPIPGCGCGLVTLAGGNFIGRGPFPPSGAVLHAHEVAPRGARVALLRTADTLLVAGEELHPVRHPADRARDGEDHREHVERDPQRAQDDAGVEVDVGVEIAFDEVLVLKGDLLQAQRDLEQRLIARVQVLEKVVARLADEGRAGVEVLVDAVPESHQAERVVPVLRAFDVPRDLGRVADVPEHVDHRLVGASVRRTPQGGDAGRDARVGVRAGAAREPHRGRARVLLVVGVQEHHQLQGAHRGGTWYVRLGADREHHLEEVLHVAERVDRVHEGLADAVLVAVGGDGGELRDHADRGKLPVLRVADVEGVVIEGRERPHDADEHSHRVGVVLIPGDESPNSLVDHRVPSDRGVELGPLRLVGQLAVEQEVADLEKVALFGELLDGVAAVEQHALLSVDVGDRTGAACGRREAGVVGEVAQLRRQGTDVEYRTSVDAFEHLAVDAVSRSIVRDRDGLAICHVALPQLGRGRTARAGSPGRESASPAVRRMTPGDVDAGRLGNAAMGPARSAKSWYDGT